MLACGLVFAVVVTSPLAILQLLRFLRACRSCGHTSHSVSADPDGLYGLVKVVNAFEAAVSCEDEVGIINVSIAKFVDSSTRGLSF